MAKDNNEVKITFKAFNQDFNKGMSEMNKESTKLRQEMKLQSEQMKHTATDSDKLKAVIGGLEKQYDIAQQKTAATAEALEKARKQWGENSAEAQKFETQLRRNEIAEQQVANNIIRTTEAMGKAVAAEKERASASSDAAVKLNELQATEDKLVQSSEKLNAQYELQKAQLGTTATESEKLNAQMSHLNKSHEVAGEKVKVYEEQLEQARKQYGESSSEVDKYERQLLEARTAEQQLANEIVAVNRTLEEQNDQLRQTSQRLQETGDKMAGIGKELTTKVTAPIAAIGGLAVKIGSDFEAGMSKVAAVSGATGDDLERLEEKAREMGASTQFSATESAAALEYMALAGWKTEDMLNGIGGIMSLAAASGEDLAKTADIVTDGLSAFGMKADESGRFADVLAAASANANTDVAGLGQAFEYVAPVAGALGFTIEDTAKAIGLMSNSGVKGAKAGTALRTMMTNLAKPTAAMEESMSELGISITDSNGEMKTFEQVMQETRGAFSDLDEAQQASAAATIFGKEAMSGALAIINTSDEDYRKLALSIDESSGAAEEMAAIVNDNLQGKLKALASALEEVALKIYEAMEPAVKLAVEALQLLVNIINFIPGPIIVVITAFAALIAAIGPVVWMVGTFLKSWGAIQAALVGFPAIATILTGALTAIKVAIASVSLPITLLVAAVGLAIFLIVKYWDEIKAATVAVFKFIIDFLKEWGLTLLVILSGPVGWIVAFIVKNWEDVKRWTTEIFTGISDFFTTIFNAISTFLGEVVASIVNFVVSKWENLSDETKAKFMWVYDTIVGIWTSISEFFSNIVEKIKTTVKKKFQEFVDSIRERMESARTVVSSILKIILDFFMQFSLFKAGIEMIQKFIEGIKSMFQTVIRVVSEVFTAILNTIKSVFGFGKKNNEMTNVGARVGNDVADGIRSTEGDVKKAAKDVAAAGNQATKEELEKGMRERENMLKNSNSESKKTTKKESLKDKKAREKEQKKANADAKKAATAAAKAERDAVSKALSDVNAKISSSRASGNSSAASEAEVWKNNIGQFKEGSKERIKAENSYAAARDKNAREMAAKEKKQQAEKDKQSRASLASSKKNDAEKKKQTQAAAKAERDAVSSTLQSVNAEIAERRANGGLSAVEEADIWKKAITQFKEGSKERIKAQNEYTAAMKRVDKEQVDAVKDRYDTIKQVADDLKSMDQLSLKQEADYWKNSIAQFKKGTKERVSAQKEYQRTLKQINDNVVGVNKKYADQMKAINDKLINDTKEASQKYETEFKGRRDFYLGFAGLFDEFEIKMERSGEDLLNNLNNQVSGFKQWQKEMEKLEYKGVGKGLIEELRQMGPKALPELLALNDLTASELNKYSNLFKEKSALATKQAENELSGMKDSTKNSIQSMTNTANKELAGLETAWVEELRKVTSATEDELQGMQQIGQDAGKSLLDGLLGMEGSLISGAVQMAKNVNAALRDALGLQDLEGNLIFATGQSAQRQTAVPESNASVYQRMQGGNQSVAPITENIEVNINVDGMTIREEADIQKVARELDVLQQQARRGRGRG